VVAVITGYCESFFSSENGFIPSQIIALLSPHDPAFEREADASSSVLEGGCSQYEEVRAHNVLEKSCIDLCPSGSCSKNNVFHSPTSHLFSLLEANLGLSVFPSPTFIFFLFSA
jgi:hypothetical protein